MHVHVFDVNAENFVSDIDFQSTWSFLVYRKVREDVNSTKTVDMLRSHMLAKLSCVCYNLDVAAVVVSRAKAARIHQRCLGVARQETLTKFESCVSDA